MNLIDEIRCFLGKAHSQAALALWNNMLEPVGAKQESWQFNQTLKCPTKENPFLFTSKNSPKKFNNITVNQTTIQTSTISLAVNNSSLYINQTSTSIIRTETSTMTMSKIINPQPELIINSSPKIKSIDISTEKPNSDTSLSKSKFLVITGFLFIIGMLLIVGLVRRRKQRSLQLRSKPGRNNFEYTNEDVYEDEVEIYSQPKKKTNFFEDNELPKTHGTRLDFE